MPVQKPKSRVGLIVGIVIGVLLFVCVGSTLAVIGLANLGSTAISTPTTTLSSPSGNTIDTTAASIVTNIQTASAVESTAYQPTPATSFHTNTDIYVSFKFNLNNATSTVTQQAPGYVQAKYYIQNRLILTDDPLKADETTDPTGYGYFTVQYYHATTDASVELYWCRKSDCTDKMLAGVAKFTVS